MNDPKDDIAYKVDVAANGYVIHAKPKGQHLGMVTVKHVAETRERLKELLMDMVTKDVNEIVENLPSTGR